MAYDDLRSWMAALERAGELKRIQTEVDPVLEITEITDRVSKAKTPALSLQNRERPGWGTGFQPGPALLFENVKGYAGSSVLINQFGSARRMRMALGVESLDNSKAACRAQNTGLPPSAAARSNAISPIWRR